MKKIFVTILFISAVNCNVFSMERRVFDGFSIEELTKNNKKVGDAKIGRLKKLEEKDLSREETEEFLDNLNNNNNAGAWDYFLEGVRNNWEIFWETLEDFCRETRCGVY